MDESAPKPKILRGQNQDPLCLCMESNFDSAMAGIRCARAVILRGSFMFDLCRMFKLICSFLSRPAPTPGECSQNPESGNRFCTINMPLSKSLHRHNGFCADASETLTLCSDSAPGTSLRMFKLPCPCLLISVGCLSSRAHFDPAAIIRYHKVS